MYKKLYSRDSYELKSDCLQTNTQRQERDYLKIVDDYATVLFIFGRKAKM